MTQPVLLRQSFQIAAMTALQSMVPWVVAVATLYVCARLDAVPFEPSSYSIVVIAVLCLILIEAPRDVTLQLASDRLPAATGVIARWLLVLAGVGAVNLLAGILPGVPPRVILVWVVVAPFSPGWTTLLGPALIRPVLLRASP